MKTLAKVFVLALGVTAFLEAQPRNQEHWVATWGTAQQVARSTQPPARGSAQAPASPATPQSINSRGFNNQTVRMIVRTSMSGRRARITLTNAFGASPVQIGAAHIALRAKDSEIVPDSDRTLKFNGREACMLGPGHVIVSDPVDLNIPANGDLAVSLYFPGETGPPTSHGSALHTTYVSKEGDAAAKPAIADAITTQSYYYLEAIDVVAPAAAGAIVAFGDSITEGARSTPDTNHSWPALLAVRLAAKKETANIGVSNMGIGGNRVLRDGSGASALARLDHDVLAQSGVKWLMLLEGINDIGREVTVPAEAVTADDLISAYKQIIERAHSHGIMVIGCTLTPFEGANYQRDNGEAIRSALNNFIRTGGAFDAVVDFEAATRDPNNPKRLRADFDPGDHLHPNDAGYQAMADAIDLGIFTGKHAPPSSAAKR